MQLRHLRPGYALAVAALLLVACSAGAPSSPSTSGAPAAGGSGGTTASGGAASKPSNAPALERAKLAYTTISAVQAPFWIAYDEGYFREQGLDVQDMGRVEPGATLLAALLNGELEWVAAGGPSLVLGNLQGMQTTIFGSTMNWMEGAIVGGRNVRTPQDLRGQTIAVSRLKAITDVAARLAVERIGLVPDVDVYTRGTGGNAESLAALEGGTVGAASLNVPPLFEANKRGYPDVLDITAMQIPFANGTLGATKPTLDRRPEATEKVLRATAQATNRFKIDPVYAAAVIAKYSNIDDPELLRGTVDVYTRLFTVDPYPDPAAVQAALDAEDNPAARTSRPEQVTDYRAADALRRSGFLDTLPKS